MTAPLLTVTFRGFTAGGPTSPVGIRNLKGWLGRPRASTSGQQRSADHGEHPGPVKVGPRTVVMEALIRDYPNSEGVLATLDRTYSANPASSRRTETLTVTRRGVTRTARVQIVEWEPVEDTKLQAAGFVPFRVSFHCPDPRIFGERITATAPLVTAPEGVIITDTLAVPFDLPAEPVGGTVFIDNPGTALSGSNVTVTLRGPQVGTPGVHHETSGGMQSFNLQLTADDVLTASSEDGGELNGEYRQAQWPSLPAVTLRALPGGNVYTALGQAGVGGSPSITVDIDPAYL